MASLPKFDSRIVDTLRMNATQALERAESGKGPYPQAWAAIAYARAGFRVVPLRPRSKRLDSQTGFRHGRDAQLPDFSDVCDLWFQDPTRNIGIAPHPRMLVVDVDRKNGATLADVEAIGLDVDNVLRERTPSGGWHLHYRLPTGFQASKGATGGALPRGVELLGPHGYSVAPHSVTDNWYALDPLGGLEFGQVPVGWPYLRRLMAPANGLSRRRIRKADREAASQLLRRMRGATEFRDGVNGLFTPSYAETIAAIDPALDATPSGRDFLLTFLASHFLRDHPRRAQILVALLWSTGWPTDKTQRRPGTDPEEYCVDTVSAALVARDAKDDQRLSRLRATLAAASPPGVPPLLDPTSDTGNTIEASVLTLAIGENDERFWPEESVRGGIRVGDLVAQGWRRVPVDDLASVHGVSTETVRRALDALVKRGMIERWALPYRHDGAVRRDSLVRLTELST